MSKKMQRAKYSSVILIMLMDDDAMAAGHGVISCDNWLCIASDDWRLGKLKHYQ